MDSDLVFLGRKCPPQERGIRFQINLVGHKRQLFLPGSTENPARLHWIGFGHSCWKPVNSNNFVESMEGKLKHSLSRSLSINKKVLNSLIRPMCSFIANVGGIWRLVYGLSRAARCQITEQLRFTFFRRNR